MFISLGLSPTCSCLHKSSKTFSEFRTNEQVEKTTQKGLQLTAKVHRTVCYARFVLIAENVNQPEFKFSREMHGNDNASPLFIDIP